ncbi:hypothetical protein APR12_004712 [Nocardia amikacinitolerans]|uniref:hypothetical protein n=1 Tax=Nocardia amikacinitolerans TaxID=756689 RepID=UPI000AB4FA77|nr:hypothetical protein [Nocardia amikacinitolerans]MCP2319345.1 hypothetical protein [Nocardia amikacinitolerans]
MPDPERLAFVAMRFAKEAWNDPTYQAISNILREAGYKVLRGDELPSSGAVVDEVLRMLREADQVVIDTTGDSSNVSYELGYCHGIGREQSSLILLRKKGVLPQFNYAHYRHHIYADIRHLQRLLRYRLGVSTPLTDDQYGYAFTMSLPDEPIGLYGLDAAESLLAALKRIEFTGRCEYYAVDYFYLQPRTYCVGIGLKPGVRMKLNLKYWHRLEDLLEEELSNRKSRLKFERDLSEIGGIRAFRKTFISCGVAEFKDGQVTALLNSAEADSNFASAVLEAKALAESESQLS